jgi:hypothetical protein
MELAGANGIEEETARKHGVEFVEADAYTRGRRPTMSDRAAADRLAA